MTKPEGHSTPRRWFETVRDLTVQLAGMPSISPSADEASVAEAILRLLSLDEPELRYLEAGLDPVDGDMYGRSNAYALLQGNSSDTVILLGHFDTVGITDYGELEPWALDPEGLWDRQEQLAALVPGLPEDLQMHPGDWMFGRGVVDMKSGVATNIAVIRRLRVDAAAGRLPLSVVFLATPDEENESAGVLQAVALLLRLGRTHGLEYVGAINTDYTTALYPGDPHRYIYTGTVGKLLPSFFIVGAETHAASPFDGFDANLIAAELIRDLSMSDDLCDQVAGQITPPPVTLHASDLKRRYDVQVPFTAYFYLNVLTYTTSPGDLLLRLQLRAEAALSRILRSVDEANQRWLVAEGDTERARRLVPRTGRVMTYSELRRMAVSQQGETAVASALEHEWEAVPSTADKRERCLHQVERLWTLSGLAGPAIILYYSPPFYPHIRGATGPLYEAVYRVAKNHPELSLELREYFPYLSDMSYLRLDPGLDVAALRLNMPVWRDEDEEARSGSYSLPLSAIQELGVPVVNLGPYGRGAHQRGERTLMSYSFEALPQLVYESIFELASVLGPRPNEPQRPDA